MHLLKKTLQMLQKIKFAKAQSLGELTYEKAAKLTMKNRFSSQQQYIIK